MRTMLSLGFAAALGVGLLWAAFGHVPGGAQESKEGKESKEDADILAAVEKLAKAFNDKDAKAFAAAWSEKAEYVDEDDGERLEGRKAIEADFAKMFAKAEQLRLEIDVDKVRRLGTDVASVDGEARVLQPKATVSRSKFLALLVKNNGSWMIDSVRESKLPAEDSNAEFLDELAWLNGQWRHQDGDTEITLDCSEVANGNFRTHRFQVKTNGRIDHEGTQVIGYDAAKKQLRSWVFSSDGSFGEGTIDSKGDRWTIRAGGVQPDGEKSTATQILTRKGDDSFTWQVIDRHVGARSLPNAPEITMTRLAGAAGGTGAAGGKEAQP